ncbi:TetR/AcrR family transcriptional regulator [Streptococcus sp. S784/96/1]|uniref:TetR/AcrR family transcriptional regulator n=1 Tax=Streptococcus sp. S784/96/1 TaxID=2653499 RepID=UPI0013894E21|nr:TetR/AcrR family transcriptional regulator C-terminal domain-containing protein [Streptococcus sp. S784/96/1]
MTKQIRHTETKNNIKKAFAQLLSQKSFEKISVTIICQTANINRGTFYLHYKDKYDMMEKLKEDTLAKVYAIVTQEDQAFSKDIVCETLHYLYQDIDFLNVLANTPYIKLPQIIREFISYILDNIPDFDSYLNEKIAIPLNYAKVSYIASIESIMTEWILSGGKESPEELTDIIFQIS